MVYEFGYVSHNFPSFEVDSTESIWYTGRQAICFPPLRFEVDSTESIWYIVQIAGEHTTLVLKLTPQSQYGILRRGMGEICFGFEVDSTESIWYTTRRRRCSTTSSFEVDSTESIWYRGNEAGVVVVTVLKLTPQSQYGIKRGDLTHARLAF